MKTLILMRHAKSDWGSDELTDIERPLNDRGRRASSLIGKYLFDQNLVPDLILVSAAVRTRETVHLMTDEWSVGDPATPRIVPLDDLYLAQPAALLTELRKVDEKAASVMIVAHNPGIADLARQIAMHGDRDLHAEICLKYPTGALTFCKLKSGDWSRAKAKALDSYSFIRPKDLVENSRN